MAETVATVFPRAKVRGIRGRMAETEAKAGI